MRPFNKVLVIGIGATLLIDCWTIFLKIFGVTTNGVRFLGRWLMYAADGKFIHHTIVQKPEVKFEYITGMIVHYCIGVAFAFLLIKIFGEKWIDKPRIVPALVVGAVSIVIPIFILQPLLGFGIAFQNLPNQGALLLKIVSVHLVYSIGLYVAGKIVSNISKPFLSHGDGRYSNQ